MSFNLSLDQLSEILEITPDNPAGSPTTIPVAGITTDSREIKAGQVFVALKGENFDGHDFLETAIERGAIGLIVERETSVKISKKIPVFKIPNTLEAYQKIARHWRLEFQIPVIAVTGSVGKTTTKELIAAVLETRGPVHKTIANYNNEIGVPKTLLELSPSDSSAVIEMGMRGAGEIALLATIAEPTIAVITNVGTAHIGRLGSEEAIALAKCELLAELHPDRIAVLNHDNPLLNETAARVWKGETVTYGLEGGDVRGKLLDSGTLELDGLKFPLPLSGRHNALNYLAALAVAKILGLDLTPLTAGLNVRLPGGRSKRHTLPDDIILLDETYNAGLESMLAALELLKEQDGKRRIAVLGTMKELGDYSDSLHYRVGKRARELGIDILLVLADDATALNIVRGAEGIETESFSTHADLIARLKEILTAGDRILFKASHSVGLDRVVNSLLPS